MRISDWSSDVCSSDLVGMPGILMAVILPFIIRDVRQKPAASTTPGADLTVMGALREVFGTRSFLSLAIGGSFVAFLTYGKHLWALILFHRSPGLSAGETGLMPRAPIGVAGLAG